MEMKELTKKLSELEDPRRQWGNKRHQLEDILVIGFCSIVCGGEDFTDMESFGEERESWLRSFLVLPSGIPDSDTFRRVFERVDAQALGAVLRDWLEQRQDLYRHWSYSSLEQSERAGRCDLKGGGAG